MQPMGSCSSQLTAATRGPGIGRPARSSTSSLNPDNPDHTIAAGERELYVSRDGGKTWRPSAAGRAGLLTWTSGDALFVIDERSAVQRSTDAGASWQMIGEVGG